MSGIVRVAALGGALALGPACGNSSGPVLEPVEATTPPGTDLRVDVLIAPEVESCAAGDPCPSSDPSACFFIADKDGPQVLFRPDGLTFLPPGDPGLSDAPQTACFRLAMEPDDVDLMTELAEQLRYDVYRLSDGEIDLDVRVHNVGSITAGFKRWERETGLFLEPTALEDAGLPLISRDTDVVYGITGFEDPETGRAPNIEHCAGSNWEAIGGFGGAAYTWIASSCRDSATFLRHFLFQLYFGLRDVVGFEDLYARDYPACGRGDPDPTRWFPRVDDCEVDPDAPSCGNRSCNNDEEAFAEHVLRVHWPHARPFSGNHCQNGVQDYGEIDVDVGGVCDRLGR